jgi:hypothetical protein
LIGPLCNLKDGFGEGRLFGTLTEEPHSTGGGYEASQNLFLATGGFRKPVAYHEFHDPRDNALNRCLWKFA